MLLCPTPTACLSQASEFARSAGAVRGKGMALESHSAGLQILRKPLKVSEP